jgi:transcriptional regulator with XRE-family HTH domain
MNASAATIAGTRLRALRAARRLSQMELSMRAGGSQRHLSWIETGRARPSREMLMALLDALDAPLPERNDSLLAAGYAPAFAQRPLAAPEMAPVREAVGRLLDAHDPAPALVLDAAWNVVQVNRGLRRLVTLLGADPAMFDGPLNMLELTLAPGGMRGAFVNADEVCHDVWQRATREAPHVPELARRIERLRPHAPAARPSAALHHGAPLLLARLASQRGELAFFSTFTTFGSPLDVTVASLRIEHLFPADAHTREILRDADDGAGDAPHAAGIR